MKKCFLLLSLAFVGCVNPDSPLETRFKSADVNGDAVVSREEATDFMVAETFKLYDTNEDGFVDKQEYVAGGGKAASFDEFTANTAGKMTLADAQSNPTIVETMAVPFDEADANGDGIVLIEEVQAYLEKVEAVVR